MDRNIVGVAAGVRNGGSLSARRAWIEIWARHTVGPQKWVALRKESVDRNVHSHIVHIAFGVVALRKESVDRNDWVPTIRKPWKMSLSARRAWIEIARARSYRRQHLMVALRKESVDRNKFISNVCPPVGRSLSARRAWIEIRVQRD